MTNPHFELLELAAELLAPLHRRIVFVGGATVSLHIDDTAVPVRSTKDVDFVVEVSSYAAYAALEEELRSHGFEQNLQEKGPICRWEKNGLLLDVLPTEPDILGFAKSDWFRKGFEAARTYTLPSGTTLEAFDAVHLLAAKIEAFEDRGGGDWLTSRDAEDIVTILDGRSTIFDELRASSDEAQFVRKWLTSIDSSTLLDAVAGHTNDYGRAKYLLEQLT